ncbi:hypothetical protein [Pseudoruegeria sp. HB172150]|uniref:hypothetical protein n=1 Tax=Pseudoruegeria sp. HB172150 TaxID=2721164 RepID=UPI0015551889|nr:hypothetical protein [Pseudoruegeria sp. HB172150]
MPGNSNFPVTFTSTRPVSNQPTNAPVQPSLPTPARGTKGSKDLHSDAILSAVGRIIKEELEKRDSDLTEKFASLDGNTILKSASAAILAANLAALREYAGNISLRRAKHIEGTEPLPALLGGILDA